MQIKILISAILLFSATMAFAEKFGENVEAVINGETLIISGTGDMYNFSYTSSSRFGNIKKVKIEDGVTSIGSYAFFGCISLTSVTIPNSVTSIGDRAFGSCSGLVYNEYDNAYYLGNAENLYLWLMKAKSTGITSCATNGNCKFIYGSAFQYCSGLTSVTIPNSVTSIGDGAFENCSKLTAVTIPSSVTRIGYFMFEGCSSLTSIRYEGSSEPTYQSTSFTNVDKATPVYVPADYGSNSWCGFTNLIKGHD